MNLTRVLEHLECEGMRRERLINARYVRTRSVYNMGSIGSLVLSIVARTFVASQMYSTSLYFPIVDLHLIFNSIAHQNGVRS